MKFNILINPYKNRNTKFIIKIQKKPQFIINRGKIPFYVKNPLGPTQIHRGVNKHT